MSRWAVRMLGLAVLLILMTMFVNLYQQLVKMQQMRKPAATRTK